jgi:hypothetical protein
MEQFNRKRLRKIPQLFLSFILAIYALFGLLSALPTYADGITVCTNGCDFSSIQAAIDSQDTLAGETINILASIHTEADIQVTKDVTIQGEGSLHTTVQAFPTLEGSDKRVFFIARGTTAAIRDMTIRHGNPRKEPESGGGIRNEGILTVENVIIRENSASAGGGILNDNTLTLINTLVEDNQARGGANHYYECSTGGGIKDQEGAITMINSTVRDNTAEGKGGGMHIACKGILLMINSTVSGNRSVVNGGGIYLNGVGRFIHSTISHNSGKNGGGIFIEGTGEKGLIRGSLHFTATMIADNTATMEKYGIPDCYIGDHGSIDSNQMNWIEASDCPAAYSGDPLLDPEWTGNEPQVHALLANSSVIDTIPAGECVLQTDQTGKERPQGAGCEIGAYEYPWESPAEGDAYNREIQPLWISLLLSASLFLTMVLAGVLLASGAKLDDTQHYNR